MQAKIRSATAADIGALTDLENRSFLTDRISRASFRRLISSPSAAVIVAVANDTLAGYAVVLFRKASSTARLYSLAVDPDYQGLGRELLAATERQATVHGSRAMRLEVRDDNLRAKNLYLRMGYRHFGEKPDYYADGATALRFEKELAAGGRNGAAHRNRSRMSAVAFINLIDERVAAGWTRPDQDGTT